MKKKLFGVLATSLGFLPLLAQEGGTNNEANLSNWVTTATSQMSQWASDLAPLFTTAITIVLIVIAWRLFKRTAKSAT